MEPIANNSGRMWAFLRSLVVLAVYLPYFFLAVDPGLGFDKPLTGAEALEATFRGFPTPLFLLVPVGHMLLWVGTIWLFCRSWGAAFWFGVVSLTFSLVFLVYANTMLAAPAFIGPAVMAKLASMVLLIVFAKQGANRFR
jgi:hypothetical protein